MPTTTTTNISVEDRSPKDRNHLVAEAIATHARRNRRMRSALFWSGLAIGPAAIGTGIGLLLRSRRAGLVAGGLTAVGLAAFRWQLQRLFNDEPDFVVEQRIGKLEVRHYLPRIEARTTVDGIGFEAALEQGFQRLADYIFGEQLAMTSPVTAAVRNGGHTMAFVMPPGRTLDSLPRPRDPDVRLVEVPARRIAVLAYRGRRTAEEVEEHGNELRILVTEAGLPAKGEPMYAGFDPPSTVPKLRRDEIWLELV